MYYIANDITNEYLIKHYGFHEVKLWEDDNDKINLEYKDKDGLGLRIWWKDRSVNILLGKHGEYGIAPIPKISLQLYNDKILMKGDK